MLLTDRNLINLSSILVYLIPFSLLTGPFLPDLLISVLGIIFLFISIKMKKYEYFKNYFFYIFLSFYFVILLSSILSETAAFSLKSSLVYFRFGIFSLAVWFIIDHQKNFMKFFFYALLSAYAIATIDGYFQYFFDYGIFGSNAANESRLALTFNDKMILGGYLSRLFPLLIAMVIFLSFEKRNQNLLLYSFIILLMVSTDILVYVSGERTAVGLMSITTILMIIFISKLRILRILSFFVSIMIIIFLTFSSSNIKERSIDLTLNQMNVGSESGDLNYLSQQHENHILSSWKIFLDNPIIGSGPNTFRKICHIDDYNINSYACSTHPHNLYLQLLAETGIVGFFFLFISLLYSIKFFTYHFIFLYIYKKENLSDFQVCLMISFILTLFPFLPTLNFFNNWNNILYYLPVGFYLFSIYSKSLEKI